MHPHPGFYISIDIPIGADYYCYKEGFFMRRYLWAFLLCIILLLCSCSAPDEDISQPETEISSISVDDFSPYYALLDASGEGRNWFHAATGCLFTSPEEIDLNFMFYLGTGNGGWEVVSEESRQYLLYKEFMWEMDLQVMPVEVLDQILLSTFGISINNVSIPNEWEYLEIEHAYCSNHNDAYFPDPITIVSVTEYSDRTVVINYTVNYFYDTRADKLYENPQLMLKLYKSETGDLLVYSNTIG